jgi:glycosyltransferase involved in cell wall biosynthesis
LPNELVLCDDGSTHRTPEILAQFAKRASFPVSRLPRHKGDDVFIQNPPPDQDG